MGGLPLLILKHTTPQSWMRTHPAPSSASTTKAAIGTRRAAPRSASGGVGRGFAAGAAAIALIAVLLQALIAAMENAGGRIRASDSGAVRSFRKLHSTALLVNLVQLCVLVWSVLNIRV